MTDRKRPSSGEDRQSPTRAAEFRKQRGALTLFVEGKPQPALLADVMPDTPPTQMAAWAEAGLTLCRLRSLDLGWAAKGRSDFAALDARVQALLAAAPAARFLLAVSVDAPLWWREANPGECAAYCLPAVPSSVPMASWASSRWRNEAGDALARLVRHVLSVEWGDRCLGFQIEAGVEGEWRHPEAERLPDIGPRMTERFRAFALERYRRNAGLLRHAWFDTRADFAAIACPDAAERRKTDVGVLRNPSRSRRLLDYYECFYDAQNTAALHFCSVVKRASAGRALVGLSYATPFGQPIQAEGGHWFPEPVLDSPDVDFFANAAAETPLALRALTGSLALREKFLFHVASAHQPPQQALTLALAHHAGLILPASTPIEALSTLKQEVERAPQAPSGKRTQSKPLAVVIDFASVLSLHSPDGPENWLNETLLNAQMREVARLGVPFDLYLLSDLFSPKLPDYPAFLFLNSFYLSEAERRRVDARIKRSGQTAIWLWSPGVIGEERIGAELGQQVCGQKLRLENQAAQLRARVVTADDPLTQGFPVGAAFGTERPIAPTMTIPDKASLRLGANAANKTVFAVRRFPAWVSIVFGAAPVPMPLLRNALEAAAAFTPETNRPPAALEAQRHRGKVLRAKQRKRRTQE